MKRLFLVCAVLMMSTVMWAQGIKPLPSLHVEGRWLVDQHGNHVVLHGVMDTPNMYFNGWRWGSPWDPNNYADYNEASVSKCLDYFEKLFTAMEKSKCTIFRLHLDPAWTNDPSSSYTYSGAKDQPADAQNEADIKKFNPSRLSTFLTKLYWPLMQKAMDHGMYVVVRPPGVCPQNLKVGDYYNKYLLTVWDKVSQNSNIKKYAGQISLELANEPVNLRNANNQDDAKALHDFFQPIVDKIRANGFTGIIWVPGTGYQSNYRSYASWPIEGYNIGYAVHDYPGWYSSSDDNPGVQNKRTNFHNAVPVVDTNPIFISEVDWSPIKEPKEFDRLNEHGDSVFKNLGTWATGSTSKWGKAFKEGVLDYFGNVSMTLTHPHDFFDIDKVVANGTVVAAFNENPEACGKACMDWYADYYTKDWAHADFKNYVVSDQGTGSYKNPIISADFPDPDVIRVGDTYYMVSTTMHLLPGATIVKSKDLVNWEYCAQPLVQLSDKEDYSLINGKDAYARGMWACSMKYHNGQFYILINPNEDYGLLLTATNPEGKWTVKKLGRNYYDPGMLFDNGKVYVACGINHITMCELDENFKFKKQKEVVVRDDSGLEGCHLYKIGDYYYIYATYGGWPSGQVAFRSKDIFGPYEEKVVVEKWYDNVPNTIHQGSLVEDTAGKWWTVMQEDLGALGRFPNLQPVKWVSDWPVVGNNGTPYKSFESKITKPKAVGDVSVKRLPTTDVFRTYPLGKQWEWNHNPDNEAWSLFDRAGWLRLKASTKTDSLPRARNMLTQRIFAIRDKATTGSIRLDVSKLNDGDRAGICVFQDPYAAIAVEKKDGKYQFVWWQDKVTNPGSSFKFSEKTKDFEMPADSVVYLRATFNYSTSKSKFYYSLDNQKWTVLGSETSMGFNLTVFVGARFGLFYYATQNVGGTADFDWFSTEDSFDEADLYPANFTAPAEKQFTVSKIAQSPATVETMINSYAVPNIKATYADSHSTFVNEYTSYVPEEDGIVEFYNGQMLGVGQGSTKVNASYTDALGNKVETTFTAKSGYFPFPYQYVRNDLTGEGTGTYKNNNTSAVFKFVKADSEMGWVYGANVDMTGYKFLVIELVQKQTANASVNIYTTENLKGACHSTVLSKTDTEIVIDLDTCKYTSTTSKGKALNRKLVRMVTFKGASAGKTLSVKNMFLSNDAKYYPAGIAEPTIMPMSDKVNVYSLSGTLLRRGVNRHQALKDLPAGIYLVGGKKIVVK